MSRNPSDPPYRHAMDNLRNDLLPINFIELSKDSLILGSARSCVTLDHEGITKLIASLLCINQELHERQIP